MSKLDDLMKEFNKDLKGDIFHRGVSAFDYERIPFTSPRLNYITYGGLPVGKLIEFYGEEHGGKTTTALDIVANYQHGNDGRTVLYVDAENTLDVVWATKLGVEVDDMIIMNPTNQGAETIFEKVLQIIDTGEIGLVVIDSLGVMLSNKALDDSVEQKNYGGIAMALTNFSKKAEMFCNKHKCTIIGINQMRDDMNSMYGGTTTTGGRAWKHNVSARIEFRRGKFFDDKYKEISRNAENPVGNYVMVAMTKNKTCPPTRHTGFYTLRYDIGIDYLYDLTELCIKYGIIEKAGAWFSLLTEEGEQITKVQGQSAMYDYLNANPETLKEVEERVNRKMEEE